MKQIMMDLLEAMGRGLNVDFDTVTTSGEFESGTVRYARSLGAAKWNKEVATLMPRWN